MVAIPTKNTTVTVMNGICCSYCVLTTHDMVKQQLSYNGKCMAFLHNHNYHAITLLGR